MNPRQLLVEPTGEIREHNGCPVRVWRGTTHDGRPCVLLVAVAGFGRGGAPAAMSELIEAKDMPIREIN